jgi:hypothetical protein
VKHKLKKRQVVLLRRKPHREERKQRHLIDGRKIGPAKTMRLLAVRGWGP